MTGSQRWEGAAIAERWWRESIWDETGRHGTRRAARARLRRAAMPLEVIQEPEALRLIARLPDENPDRLAILAGILAFVRDDDEQSVARAIGRKSLDDDASALMSEGRFRRLLQAGGNDLMDPMRRLVRLTKGKANIRDLSFAVLRWGDGVKKRWIFEYYGVAERAGPAPFASASSLIPLQPDR